MSVGGVSLKEWACWAAAVVVAVALCIWVRDYMSRPPVQHVDRPLVVPCGPSGYSDVQRPK